MGTYLKLIFKHAIAKSFLLTDRLSTFAGVILPAILFVSGDAMQENLAGYVAWAIIITVGGGVSLRLLFSPYFIWKEDQAEIARLNDLLNEPRRKIRYELRILAIKKIDTLRNYLVAVLSDVQKLNEISENFIEAVSDCRPIAGLFIGEADFEKYWKAFELNLRGWQSVRDYAKAAGDTITAEEQIRIADRAVFHCTMVTASSMAMVDYLGMGESHKDIFERESKPARNRLDEIDFDFDRQPQSAL